MQQNVLKNRKNWKQYIFTFLSLPSALIFNTFPSLTIKYFEQSVLVISNSFHTFSSTPGVRSLPPLLWRNCFLHITSWACGWNWPFKTLVLWRLLDPWPRWGRCFLILCPFFSELFLPWPRWPWPLLVLLLQWLFSFLLYPSQAHFPQSILDVNVTHISVSYLFSISTLSESFSTSMAPDVTSLQVTSKPTFNWCFLQFTLESTSMSTC